MQQISIKTPVPGPRSHAIFEDKVLDHFIAGKPDNETLLNVVFEEGQGAFIRDVDGNWYIDCNSCLNLPFGHQLPIQSLEAPPVNSSNYLTPQRSELIRTMSPLLPCFDGFQFRSSGTESVEAAIRYARHCFPSGLTIAALQGAYHGLTLAAQQVMGKASHPEVQILPFPTDKMLGETMSVIENLLLSSPMLFVFESTQGNTLRSLPKAFFEELNRLRRTCADRLLLFCDDMLLSIRCGQWCSTTAWLQPDLFVGGKSWSSGYPFSFFAVTKEVRERGGDIVGTTTYGGNPLSCFAVAQTIQRIQRENILEHVCNCEAEICNEWLPRWQRAPRVIHVYCKGLLFGVAVKSASEAQALGKAMLASGVLVAQIRNVLRFSPPLNITRDVLHQALTVITKVLNNQSN